MARKNKWLVLLKRLFGSDVDSKHEKKGKMKRWVSANLKSRCLPALPGLSLQRSRSLGGAEHEQSKRAVGVAVESTLVAVAAAQTAAEVVRLTQSTLSYPHAQEVAAIKIQTAFRGYLARSALKALKGLVKLQALIRGQVVRQQTANTLRGLQSLMKIQSQTCASRARALMDCQIEDYKNITPRKTKNSEIMKIAKHSSARKCDNGILSQEEEMLLLNTKRERALEYLSSCQDRRRPTTPLSTKSNSDVVEERRLSWLDEWVGGQPSYKDIPEIFSTPCRDYNTRGKLEVYSKLRSFNQSPRASTEDDDDSFTSSPSFPSYMATTASAKAKCRSLSSPRQRLRSTDSCSDYCVPTTDRLLSPVSSVASDTGFTKIVKAWESPQHKSRSGPLKCRHSSDHVPSDRDRHSAFR